MTLPQWIRERPGLAFATGALVIAGWTLRVPGAGGLLLFGDEVHSLSWAIGHRSDWLAPYAPLGLWNELVMSTVGLDEWWLRLPALAAGCLAIALIGGLALRFLPAFEALAVTGFCALSPYLAYLSREARTYSLVLLLTTACGALVLGWLARPRTVRLLAAALCGALAVVLHTAIAPTVAVAAALAIVEAARRGELRRRRSALFGAAALFATVIALAIGPIAGAVLANVRTRAGASHADLSTALAALRFGLSIPVGGAAWSWLALLLAGLGISRLGRLFPVATSFATAALAAQLVALLALQPTMLSVPWILLRYLAHGLPFAALAVAAGLAAPLAWIHDGTKRARAGTAFALAGCAAFGLQHAVQGRYGAIAGASQTLHPILQQASRVEIAAAARDTLPRFYRETLPTLAPGALVEAPLVMIYPLYALYQREHGRPFYGAAIGPGVFQHAGRAHAGLELERALDALSLPATAPSDAAYLVVHKKPWQEISFVSKRFRLAATTQHRIDERALGHVFQHRELALPPAHRLAGARVYEDEVVAVYALRPAP